MAEAPSDRKEPRGSSSVSRILSWAAIYLGLSLPAGSCDQPEGFRRAALKRLPIRPCTGWGLPGRRVTTAPVRSYRTISPSQPVKPACCVFSVALSLGFPPLDVIQHPALRCPDFPQDLRQRRTVLRLPRLPKQYISMRLCVEPARGPRKRLGLAPYLCPSGMGKGLAK